jgi:hypothetical protein
MGQCGAVSRYVHSTNIKWPFNIEVGEGGVISKISIYFVDDYLKNS